MFGYFTGFSGISLAGVNYIWCDLFGVWSVYIEFYVKFRFNIVKVWA